MCKGVTVCGLATSDVAASHAHTCWGAHTTFSANGVVGLKSRAVCIVEVRALAGLDLSHPGPPGTQTEVLQTRTEIYATRRAFIADRVFFISIAIVSGPTPPGTGVR